jgi:insertion element IS1 protein InsB
MIEKLHLERLSQRAIARTTGMSRMRVAAILKNAVTPIGQTIQPLVERPILELDELWSFVGRKSKQIWIWVALKRQTRRIVGLAFGDRTSETCRKLWQSLPPSYRKRAICYSDFWVVAESRMIASLGARASCPSRCPADETSAPSESFDLIHYPAMDW